MTMLLVVVISGTALFFLGYILGVIRATKNPQPIVPQVIRIEKDKDDLPAQPKVKKPKVKPTKSSVMKYPDAKTVRERKEREATDTFWEEHERPNPEKKSGFLPPGTIDTGQ